MTKTDLWIIPGGWADWIVTLSEPVWVDDVWGDGYWDGGGGAEGDISSALESTYLRPSDGRCIAKIRATASERDELECSVRVYICPEWAEILGYPDAHRDAYSRCRLYIHIEVLEVYEYA